MSDDYLMNIASVLFFVCYIPEFYANFINKNSNCYNVIEKVVLLIATTFAFSYSIKVNNKSLIINYGPLFALDVIALSMRIHYAYKNRNINVRVIKNGHMSVHENIENLIRYIENPINDNEINDIENNL
jgi:hypothetical protein